jgi:hypothetical protein
MQYLWPARIIAGRTTADGEWNEIASMDCGVTDGCLIDVSYVSISHQCGQQ